MALLIVAFIVNKVIKISNIIFINDMVQNEFKTTVLAAEEGKYLTQSFEVDLLERVVASTIALGKFDSVDNWKEITKEEGDTIREQQAEARKQPKE